MIARPFNGAPGSYERTPNRHDFSLEPRRPNYLSLVRDAGHKVYGVGKIGDIFAHQDIDEEFPTKSNVEGIQKTEELLRTIDDGFVFTNLVETDSLWGHRNDPVNFHRCLQDFDRRLPDLLDALRPNDLLILTSDHGCDPTTPSTDHSREHALLLAYVEGRNAAGRIHEDGEFADVGATVNAWLGGKSRAARRPGHADRRAVSRLDDPALVAREYADESRLRRRAAGYAGAGRATTRASRSSPPSSRRRRGACSRSAAAGASSRSGSRARPGRRSSRSTSRRAWSSSRASAESTRSVADVQALPFADGDVRRRGRRVDALPRAGSRSRRSRRSRACCGRAGRSSRRRTRASTSTSCASSSAAARRR